MNASSEEDIVGAGSSYTDITASCIEPLPLAERKALGQYMTPATIGDMMAARLFDGLPADGNTHGTPSVIDPACGTGELLLAVHRACPTARLAGCDVDPRMIDAAIANLSACDVRKVKNPDAYTQSLVQMYVVFVAGDEIGIGGSLIDYCAWHCVDALNGYKIRLRDGDKNADTIRKSMRSAIAEHALEPQRELDLLADAGVML